MKGINEKAKHIHIDITVVFVIPVGLFYLYTILATPEEALLGSEQPGVELVGEGQKFLAKLNELKALKLDMGLFESAVYKSLIDTTVPPPTEDKGRPNPFIPPATVASQGQGSTVPKGNTNTKPNTLIIGR